MVGPGSLERIAGLRPGSLILSAWAEVLEQFISHVFCVDSYHMGGKGKGNDRMKGRGGREGERGGAVEREVE